MAWINADLVQIDGVTQADIAPLVVAGRGGIGVDTPVSIGVVNATPVVLTGFDTEVLSTPVGITQNLVNDGLIFNEVGVWVVYIKISLTMDEINAGTTIAFRFFNKTKGTYGTATYRFPLGRNTGGATIPLTLPFDITSSIVGDVIQLAVLSESDTFTSVVNAGTVFSATRASEFIA